MNRLNKWNIKLKQKISSKIRDEKNDKYYINIYNNYYLEIHRMLTNNKDIDDDFIFFVCFLYLNFCFVIKTIDQYL